MANITFSEASGIADSIYGKSQAPIRMFIEKKAEAFEQNSIIKEIFVQIKSKNFAEKLTAMNAMENGFIPVGENGATPRDEMSEGFSKTLEPMTWKNSFSVSREMVEDAKLLDLKQKPNAFVTSYYRTRETFGAALLGEAIKGNTATSFKGKEFSTKTADGVCLFSKLHPSSISKNSGKQSNCFSDAFSVDALSAAECAMQGFKGDANDLLDVSPNTIVIPNEYTLKKAVFAAIGADKDPATANNGFNYQYGRWNVIVWNYLNQFITSGTKPWLLLDKTYNENYIGAAFTDRTDLDVSSHVDENTQANVWNGFARFSAGFSDWRFAAVGGVSGGTDLIGD